MPSLERAAYWLSQLIAMDTQNGNGDEVACVQMLYEALRVFSPDSLTMQKVKRSREKSDSAYVLAVWGRPRILLNVHIDTVPAGEGWTGNPLKLRRKAERLIGLGTSDIKGAAACILAALEAGPAKDVAVLFSGDEEHGSEVMPAAIKGGHTGSAPMAIICEPTGGLVGRRHRGMLAFSAKASGPGGHSSLADNTDAPLLQLSRLAAAIGDYGTKYLDYGVEPYKGLCVNIGDMRSDGAYNVIPTTAELWFSLRPPPGDDVSARAADISQIATDRVPDVTLDQIVLLQPFQSKNISAFAPVFADKFKPGDLPYWTEAAMLSQSGVNAVVYGPGEIEQAHKPDEFVTVSALINAMAVYRRALDGIW